MNQAATVVVQKRGTAQRIVVTISIKGDEIEVTPDPFYISKSKQEEVLWVTADPDLEFTVEFDKGDSPFYEVQFDHKDFPASGLVRRGVLADPQRKYKYTVRAGGAKLDPGGVVTK